MLNIRLPEELERKLLEEARLTHKSRSEMTREALTLYLRIRRRRRFVARMRLAAAALNGADAAALADESLRFDNEALAVADAHPGYNFREKWWE